MNQSKRAKSEQVEDFDAAIVSGQIVAARCLCTSGWLAAGDVGSVCGHCGERMGAA